ncbi:MAG: 2 domain protein [Haloplasmataceae bacterium]|nr:2 domain protein [Haloplasmataceae bacterium]
MKLLNASVHDIVDYVFASGDIVPAFVAKNNMKDGTMVHIEVQKQYDSEEKEVYVKHECEIDDYLVTIQGRIDILEKIENKYQIIEIKTVSSFDHLELNLMHIAQAKFYGYMLFKHFNLNQDSLLTISVLYVNKYSMAKKYFTFEFNYITLETFYLDTIRKYLDYICIIDQHQSDKLASIVNLSFPYPFREGQNKLVESVLEIIEKHNNLFVCAPTGIGKSLGTIYPAIQSMHSGEDKIFYLTAKSIVKDVARGAVSLMRKHSDLKFKSISLTAKEKICINKVCKCNPIDCPFAKGFFNRINDAVIDIFQNEDDLYYESIIEYSKKHQICPFEYQLALSSVADMVICDYNYVFDIRVYLRRFFEEKNERFTLLIDEAHNMYDRVCNMYTISINFNLINNILDQVDKEKEIIKTSNSIYDKLTQYGNLLTSSDKKAMKYSDLDEGLLDSVANLISRLEKYFDSCRDKDLEITDELLTSYFELVNFIKVSEFYSDDFIVWVENINENIDYKIVCLNPRDLIKMKTDHVKASVFFSATLHPIDYYISLLGGDQNASSLVLESPFEKEKLHLIINNHISTKYKDRDLTKYQIAYQIEAIIKRGGKYLIYLPSYQYLELVYHTFNKITEVEAEIIKQSREMSERAKNEFINKFDETKKNMVGFAVLGGVFAEGIDLKGDKLNGVVIVGVGLPVFDDFRNELKTYFEKVYQKGYQYAYVYPGFNKIQQAVGRVIRDETDKGVALLIDDRYLTNDYLRLFPKHWSHYTKI